MRTFKLLVTGVLLSILILSGCDASDALNKAFAKLGLTRLAVVRDDIQPGAVMVSSSKAAIYADNLTDYVPKARLTIESEDKTREASGYIPQLQGSQKIEPKLALEFLASVLPIGPSANFSFTNSVNISQIQCKVRRIPIVQINQFLNNPDNAALAAGLKPYFDTGNSVFVVYEIWRSSKIQFNSEAGSDVTTSVKVGEIKPLSNIEASVVVNRSSKEQLSIETGQPYTFAVKLLKLERDPAGNLVTKLTNFTPPEVLKGPDDQFTFATPNMQGVVLKTIPPSERLTVLAGEQISSLAQTK